MTRLDEVMDLLRLVGAAHTRFIATLSLGYRQRVGLEGPAG